MPISCAGTPVQNNLDELWALLILMPSLFGSSEDFQGWFGMDCQLEEEEVLLVTSRLHQILRPFMLRRLKDSVATELPAKVGTAGLAGKWPSKSHLYCSTPHQGRPTAEGKAAGGYHQDCHNLRP